jgi:transcriptional regulator with AAA-type ATPase domain
MTRKEILFETLDALTAAMTAEERESKAAGFSAEELSVRTGYDRSNVSRDLNALVQENRAVKLSGRPVRFLGKAAWSRLADNVIGGGTLLAGRTPNPSVCPPPEASPFARTLQNLIGAEGSMKSAIDLAKMSVIYPRKLNILLTGETGVGKTTFAESVYLYAKEQALIDSGAAFVSFNCSEYADNPQLLFSHLFGHAKGAFTGADCEKKGLVEEAEGGILLLDEIHRLKYECQEMLFQLIDKGCYRKLGASGAAAKANLILIGATTERIDSFLLGTFKRRFPVVIHIPALAERPPAERFRMIVELFYRESQDLRLSLRVNRDAMSQFLAYPCAGNIGQLAADIRLTCANCLRLHVDENREMLIDDSVLLPHIRSETAIGFAGRAETDRLLGGKEAFLFDARHERSARPEPGNAQKARVVNKTNLQTLFREIDRTFRERSPGNPSAKKAAAGKPAQKTAAGKPTQKTAAGKPAKKADAASEASGRFAARASGDFTARVSGDFTARASDDPDRKAIRIVTTCITGEGSATKIAERIKKEIPLLNDANILVIPANMDRAKKIDPRHIAEDRLLAVVGTVDPDIDGVPFISLEELVLEDGVARLKALVEAALRDCRPDEDRVRLRTLELLRSATMFIDNEKVMREGEKSFRLIPTDLSPQRLQSLRIRFLLHLACTLERILQKLPLESSATCGMPAEAREHCAQIRRAMEGIEAAFGVEIPDAEIGFLYDLIYTV